MKKRNILLIIFCAIFFLPLNILAQEQNHKTEQIQEQKQDQDTTRYYINIGYITNIKKCPECKKADQGASIRLGLLTKKRLGFYAGYVFFKEFHPDYAEYDDEGYGFIGGIDFLVLRKKNSKLYLKAGLFNEKFRSTYRNGRTETETSLKPDFGLLFIHKYFNAYLGWQPSDPSHINIGIGMTM